MIGKIRRFMADETAAAQSNERPPSDPKGLWNFIHELADDERLSLLAHCVSLNANAIRIPGRRADGCEAHADILAREVALDITAYWQPTASGYFDESARSASYRPSARARPSSRCRNLASMKKPAMAEAAETALAGKRWLPAPLRQAPDKVA
jgi:ParB family transcriptional regulator, chromosome partitioning protein